MREISVNRIIEEVSEMCIQVNHFLSNDMKDAYKKAYNSEESEIGKKYWGSYRRILI